jgi:hypothetical protein
MITLDSDIGIKKIQVLYDSIRNEFKKSDEVIIDFSNVDRVDLSVIQLVIAAGRDDKLDYRPRGEKHGEDPEAEIDAAYHKISDANMRA